jgi:osmotically-inducible protein OsmY
MRISTFGFLCVGLLSGCVANERKIAKHIDPTQEILQDVSKVLSVDPELSRFSIAVDGFKGDMRLKGQVQTEAQKTRAEKIVWSARGVRSVKNELDVQTGITPQAPVKPASHAAQH